MQSETPEILQYAYTTLCTVTLRRCLATLNANVNCILPNGPVPGAGSDLFSK